jgi:hypothetical protein
MDGMKVPSSNFITSHLCGRLGNQMFQIANGYSMAKTCNRQYVAPSKESNAWEFRDSIFRNIDFSIDSTKESNYYEIDCEFEYKWNPPHEIKPTVYRGYFQSEKFFLPHADSIVDIFSPTKEFIEKAYAEYPQLNYNTVTINVRRTDYLLYPNIHPCLTLEYIYEAVRMMPNADYYFISSDDLDWCKQNIVLPNCVFVNYNSHEAMWLASLTKNFIISNSSFAWWGAYLCKNKNKIVLMPEVWFGPEGANRKISSKDICPVGWKIFPSYYKDGMIYPIL